MTVVYILYYIKRKENWKQNSCHSFFIHFDFYCYLGVAFFLFNLFSLSFFSSLEGNKKLIQMLFWKCLLFHNNSKGSTHKKGLKLFPGGLKFAIQIIFFFVFPMDRLSIWVRTQYLSLNFYKKRIQTINPTLHAILHAKGSSLVWARAQAFLPFYKNRLQNIYPHLTNCNPSCRGLITWESNNTQVFYLSEKSKLNLQNAYSTLYSSMPRARHFSEGSSFFFLCVFCLWCFSLSWSSISFFFLYTILWSLN